MNPRSARPGCAFVALAGASFAVATTLAAAAVFDVDSDHRTVYFAVAHREISYVRGRFLKLDATVAFDPQAKTGSVVANVDASSVDTGNHTIDDVLRSPQFLDTAQFPEVRYVGENFVFEGDALTAIDGTFRTAFDRSRYGLTRSLPDVGDRVELEINIEATRR